AAWLKDYRGTIVCDDYAGYTKLKKDNPNINLQRCFAHVRRRFMDIIKSVPESDMKDSYAAKIIEVIGRLFHLEAEYKRQKLTPREILKARNKTHPVIHKELEVLVFNTLYKPNSAIEGAINYTKKVWPELFTYMDSGYVEISNNIAERAVKPFVLNRKVFMTSGSYAGARYTTQIFSIIRTARINDINVSSYLEYVLDNIQFSPIETLLPYHPDILKRFKNT
ncbi:transposase, partial [Acholeplasma vituli]